MIADSQIVFRPQVPDDESIVRDAHVAHRLAMFASSDLPAETTARLGKQQHELQERHIASHHPSAEHRMIVCNGIPVGRLCVDRSTAPWRLIDLALVPGAQGRGMGGEAVRELLGEAAEAGVGVELQVAWDNARAEKLYRRLGFEPAAGSSQTHHRMVWQQGCVS